MNCVDTRADPEACLHHNRESLPKLNGLEIENPSEYSGETEEEDLLFIFSRVGHKLIKLSINRINVTQIAGFLNNLQELTLNREDRVLGNIADVRVASRPENIALHSE